MTAAACLLWFALMPLAFPAVALGLIALYFASHREEVAE